MTTGINEQNFSLFAQESTFETLPTMEPLIIESGTFDPTFEPEMLEDMDGSARLMDEQNPIESLFKGGAKFGVKFRPHSAQITAAAPGGTTPGHLQLLEMIMGGMKVGAGSTITAGTTSSVTVTSAAGFTIGQVFGISGNGTVVPAVITNIAVNVISFWPALPVAVTTGTALNGYFPFATETNGKSGSFQHSWNDVNEQYEFRGCIGKFGMKTELGKLMMLDIELIASSGQRGALGLTPAVQTQTMGLGGFAIKSAVCLLQAPATTTRTNVDFEDIAFEYDPGVEHLPSHAGTNGRRGVQRMKGRSPAKIKITVPYANAWITAYRARTEMRLLYAVPSGSGTAQRFGGAYCPKVIIAAEPVPKNRGGERVLELSLLTKIDNTAAADSIAGAPIQLIHI